jgi:hypothetical protein
MSKRFKLNNCKFKSVAFSVAAIATSCLIGMTAACSTDDDSSTDTEKVTTKQDTQVLQNGNFEFFDDNDGSYFISSPDNWTSGTKGTASDSLSGIINTSYSRWGDFTDDTLPQTLADNDELEDDDENKVDYNGMENDDLPYKNSHDATENDAEGDALAHIDNPYTHSYKWDTEGNLLDASGNKVDYYTDDDGNIYLTKDSDGNLSDQVETNVLMIHNYVSDNNRGTEYYYQSSTTLTLEAHTAAALSVWVKTSELYYGNTYGDRTGVTSDRGAYIKVDQTVGGTSLDSFYIKNINTEILNPDNSNNGWMQYTIYVQACDFASTTVTLSLGLGENSNNNTVEGYAFFDDISYVKYKDVSELAENETKFDASSLAAVTCYLDSEEAEKTFRTDTVTIKTNDPANNNQKVIEYYGKNKEFYINLADTSGILEKTAYDFNSTNVLAGFTVDDDGYVSSKGTLASENFNLGTLTTDGISFLPTDIKKSKPNGISVEEDILKTISISASTTQSNLDVGNSAYKARLYEALKNAYTLPGASTDSQVLLMLSAQGAAYEAQLSNTLFEMEADSYKIISFWVKTSDMNNNSLTVTATDIDDEDASGSFTVNSTTVSAVTINDEEVYDGWAQCFVVVSNPLDVAKTFNITINYGPTTIKGTTASSYYGGWAAITNMYVLEADEDMVSYASNNTRVASVTFEEASSSSTHNFDSVSGNSANKITEDIARPASYSGVNGNSAMTKTTSTELTDYDQRNKNAYAGLINKDSMATYIETVTNPDLTGCEWYSAITALKNVTDADTAWSILAGNYSVQPLLIVNTVRSFAEKGSAIYNYGYVATSSSSFSSDNYTAVSVKVKVSEGAIATVYLVDSTTLEVLGYTLPTYTFWYDDDGNVLKGDPADIEDDAAQKANIAYTLREDGLYEDADGKLYANFYNLSIEYYDESASYYDENGKMVDYDDPSDLDSSVLYYADSKCTTYAPHYLVNTDGDRIYSYAGGLIKDGKDARTYNYFVSNEVSTDYVISNFDTSIARYNFEATPTTPYTFTIDARDESSAQWNLRDTWVTVNFLVHTGSQSKSYRLELWSGVRDAERMTDKEVKEGSYVLFDYSYISLDSSSYESRLSYYTDAIIAAYKAKLSDEVFNSSDENIAYFEQLLGSKLDTYNYSATYYTYTLFDSADFLPFNSEAADETQLGYDYAYSDYDESLALLVIEDLDDAIQPTYNMFIDYSVMDQDIEIETADEDEDEDTDEDEDEDTTDAASFWLLFSSICLVVAIIFVLIAVLLKDLIKKLKRKKTSGKNSYNYNKNKRYVKKYVKANGEAPVQDKATSETPAEAPAETPVEETPVENTPAEETPAETQESTEDTQNPENKSEE